MKSRVKDAVHRAGFDLRVHPGKRRAQLLNHHGVDLVLDVGAAHGQTGQELRRYGYRGRIISFEPLAEPFARLHAAAERDHLWDCHRLALSDTDGESAMHVSANSDSSSLLRVSKQSTDVEPASAQVGTQSVRLARLDTIAADLGIGNAQRVYAKFDVQGAEAAALAGAVDTLPAIWGLQLEVSVVELYRGAPTAEELIDLARDAGYRLRGAEGGFLNPATGEQLQNDLVFLRD